MLIITRNVGTAFHIGDDVIVRILGKDDRNGSGNYIRIGIEAPPEINIVREELLDKKVHSLNISQELAKKIAGKTASQMYRVLEEAGVSQEEMDEIINTIFEQKSLMRQ